MKRLLAVLLAVLCGLSVLVACHQQPDEPETPTTPTVSIIANGKTDYKIVRSDLAATSSPEVKAAIALRKAIEAATDCKLDISNDYDEKDPDYTHHEILVGATNRDGDTVPTLEKNQFSIRFDGTKIYLHGGSEQALMSAINYLLTQYLGYDQASGTYAKSDLALPETLSLLQTFDYPNSVYIISRFKNLGGKDTGEDNWNDIVRLISSLQGRYNKEADKNGGYIYWDEDNQDKFWLEYISTEGKLLGGLPQEKITNWDQFWTTFGDYVLASGIVLWDPDVPATANVAATICSVEGYLPVRYNTEENSLYQWLKAKGVPVKADLVLKFDGTGTIPDTTIPSTGSAKCDAYLWAMDQYMDRCSSTMLAYVLDGASCVPGNPIYEAAEGRNPRYNQLYSHDYYIYNECFFIDLTCTADELPCDDPTQPMGTDAKTLRTILSTMSERNNGKMTKLMGFPPWYMKYTTFRGHSEKIEPVTLEWNFVDVLSEYNFVKEADAAHPAWMTNASVYCQYQLSQTKYTNNKSQDETLTFDKKTRYFTIYMGDYDSSAWLKEKIPTFFEDGARSRYSLMWGFNPNLSDRVPMIFDYVYENLGDDCIVTGDSGAGYVVPSLLADLDEWVTFNEPYMEKFDMDIVGFIINTTHPMTKEIFAAYAEIAPVGSFHNDSSKRLTIYNDETVFMHLQNGIDPAQSSTPATMYEYMNASNATNFAAFRTVVQSPTAVANCIDAFLDYANAINDGYTYEYVDPYTLFRLALESGQGTHISG